MTDPSAALTVRRTLPTGPRVVTITTLSALTSILVNAALVWLATAFDAPLRHYSHFRFWDYGSLTAVGVAGAGGAWFLATRYLTTPRPTFFRAALVAMLVLWLPDLYLYLKHEPTRGVVFLVIMHATVALITYNFLVFGAPPGSREVKTNVERAEELPRDEIAKVPHVVWTSLMVGVGIEFFAGLIGMLYVPFNRPDGWLSHRGEGIYLLHSVAGGLLGVAALALFVHVSRQRRSHRVDRVAAVTGLCGVLVGALGGFMCVVHSLRLLGMALMFLGVSVAFFGYLIPMIDETSPVATGDAAT